MYTQYSSPKIGKKSKFSFGKKELMHLFLMVVFLLFSNISFGNTIFKEILENFKKEILQDLADLPQVKKNDISVEKYEAPSSRMNSMMSCSAVLSNLNSTGFVPNSMIAYDAGGSAFGCGTETMYPSPLITSEQAGSFATASCPGAPTYRGLDESFQVVVGGNLIVPTTGGAEIEGRVAIGGNLQVNKSYSLSESGGGTYVIGAAGNAVGVDGTVTGAGPISLGFNNLGATYNIVSGGGNTVSLNNGTKIQNSSNLPLDVAAFMGEMSCLSADLRDANPTGSFDINSFGNGFFVGNNSPDIEIFNVDGSLLNPTTSQNSGYTDVDLAATLIVNVSGTSVDLNYTVRAGRVDDPTFSAFGGGPLVYNVIWNFYEATSINLKTDFHGTIIAPLANVDVQNNFNGRLYIGGDLTHSGSGSEIHNYPFQGNLSAYCVSCSSCTAPTVGLPNSQIGTCQTNTSNDDATITISNISGADIAGIVLGTDYNSNGIAYNVDANTNAALETITTNTVTFSGLVHDTQYTVRVFNGANDCFTDVSIRSASITCPPDAPSPPLDCPLHASVRENNCCESCESGNVRVETSHWQSDFTNLNSANLALHKPSIFNGTPGLANSNAHLATDGRYAGDNDTNFDYAFSNTGNYNRWDVDLVGHYDIESINIYTKTDCCAGDATNYRVFISNTLFASTDYQTLLNDASIANFSTPIIAGASASLSNVNTLGRFVRVFLEGSGQMQLVEVEIIGSGNANSNPYSYTWSDSAIGNDSMPDCLAPGTYQVTVTDVERGCTVSEEIIIAP